VVVKILKGFPQTESLNHWCNEQSSSFVYRRHSYTRVLPRLFIENLWDRKLERVESRASVVLDISRDTLTEHVSTNLAQQRVRSVPATRKTPSAKPASKLISERMGQFVRNRLTQAICQLYVKLINFSRNCVVEHAWL
jgi:uncharacterized protein YgbK (DUF1537 family)